MSTSPLEQAFTRARHARRQHDGAAVLAILTEAIASTRTASERVRAHWKLSKAMNDYGTSSPLEVLEPVITAEGLVDSPTLRASATRLLRSHQDRYGYGHPTAVALWSRLEQAALAAKDRPAAARARMELHWDALCRGELADVHAGVMDLERKAESPPADLLHLSLRAANWSHQAAEAKEVLDILGDAPLTAALWEAWTEASIRFGFPPPPVPPPLAPDALRALMQRALQTPAERELAAERARVYGPEWALCLRALPDGSLTDEDLSFAHAMGCQVFVLGDQAAKAGRSSISRL